MEHSAIAVTGAGHENDACAMPHWADRVLEDTRVQSRPRRSSKFVCTSTGVCTLCGVGLGKRFRKGDRREHQQSPQHTSNFERYVTEFTDAWERVRKERQAERLFKSQELGRRLACDDPVACEALVRLRLAQCGLCDWMDASGGNIVAAKAAVLDTLLDDTQASRAEAALATERHVATARRFLAREAAASVLAENPDGA